MVARRKNVRLTRARNKVYYEKNKNKILDKKKRSFRMKSKEDKVVYCAKINQKYRPESKRKKKILSVKSKEKYNSDKN